MTGDARTAPSFYADHLHTATPIERGLVNTVGIDVEDTFNTLPLMPEKRLRLQAAKNQQRRQHTRDSMLMFPVTVSSLHASHIPEVASASFFLMGVRSTGQLMLHDCSWGLNQHLMHVRGSAVASVQP